jgi:hypothetical protein
MITRKTRQKAAGAGKLISNLTHQVTMGTVIHQILVVPESNVVFDHVTTIYHCLRVLVATAVVLIFFTVTDPRNYLFSAIKNTPRLSLTSAWKNIRVSKFRDPSAEAGHYSPHYPQLANATFKFTSIPALGPP